MITINYTYTNVKLDTTLIQIVFVNTIVFIDMYTYTNYIYIYNYSANNKYNSSLYSLCCLSRSTPSSAFHFLSF